MPEHGGHNIPPMPPIPPMPGISPKLLQMPLPQAFSAPREASAAFSPASNFFYLIFTAKHQVVLGSIVSLHPVFNAVRFYISQHRGSFCQLSIFTPKNCTQCAIERHHLPSCVQRGKILHLTFVRFVRIAPMSTWYPVSTTCNVCSTL